MSDDGTFDKCHIDPDRAIKNSGDDLLKRTDFANYVARAIQGYRDPHGFVIGLSGSWGCGKSSVKNLVLEQLAGHEEQISLVEFEPWLTSSVGGMVDEVFTLFAHTLSCNDQPQLARKLRAYAKSLLVSGSLPELLAMGFPGAGTGINLLLQAFKDLSNKSEQESIPTADNYKSLRNQKEELSQLLQKSKKKVLIVIDDIDRLNFEQIVAIFQLVKATADFPNVIFLLVYQQDTVIRALDERSSGQGQAYLEKIVQMPLAVPEPSALVLQEMLYRGLGDVLGVQRRNELYDVSGDFRNLLRKGIARYIRTPRGVKRLLSSLSFSFSAWGCGTGQLDVVVQDMILLDVLRHFEPTLWKLLPTSKGILTGGDFYWKAELDISQMQDGVRENKKSTRQVLAEALMDSAGIPTRPDTVLTQHPAAYIMRYLFPALDSALEAEGSKWFTRKLVRMSVGHEQGFDRYFRLAVPEFDVSMSEVHALLHAKEAPAALSLLRHAVENQSLASLLAHAVEQLPSNPPERSEQILQAILDVSDSLPARNEGLGISGEEYQTEQLIVSLLELKKGEAWNHFKTAIENSTGLYMVCRFVRYSSPPSSGKTFPLQPSGKQWESVKRVAVERLRLHAKNGTLKRVHFF